MPFSVFLLLAEDVHLHLPSQLPSLHAPVRAHGQSLPPVHWTAETRWAWPGQGKIPHSQGLPRSLPKPKCSYSRESSVGLNRLKTRCEQLEFDPLFAEIHGEFPHCSTCPPWGLLLLLHCLFYQDNLWTSVLNRPKSALWKSNAEVLLTSPPYFTENQKSFCGHYAQGTTTSPTTTPSLCTKVSHYKV